MTVINRRTALTAFAGFGFAGVAGLKAGHAAGAEKTIRVGVQKYGSLTLLRGKGLLEKRLEPLGRSVKWAEFAAGPQMLEALNAGAIDVAQTGEAPPIFAQAANPDLVYLAFEPASPRGEAILVQESSRVASVAELRGRTIGLNKGSNVHFLLVQALEKAGLPYDSVKLAFLPPADGRAAFEKGAIDAWAIWDPFFAAAELGGGAKTLVTAEGLAPNYQFLLGSRAFADANPEAVAALVGALDETTGWIARDTEAAAAALARSTGIPAPILAHALQRQNFGAAALTPQAVADQQKIAETFLGLGLLPKPIVISQAVWRGGA